jgi:hypothetical protein
VKIQIIWRKCLLEVIGKTLQGDVNKLFVFESLFAPQANFPAKNLNFSLKVKVMGLNPGYLLNRSYFNSLCGKNKVFLQKKVYSYNR